MYSDPFGLCEKPEIICRLMNTVSSVVGEAFSRIGSVFEHAPDVVSQGSQAIAGRDFQGNQLSMSERAVAGALATIDLATLGIHPSSTEYVGLTKQLASQAQMAEVGTVIAGQGARRAFRDAGRVAAQYGGEAADWVKMRSSSFRAADGMRFETHWLQNLRTGVREEFKTVL